MKKLLNATLVLSLFSGSMFAASLQEIQAKKEVRIALSTKNQPFSVLKNGQFVGFEVELAKKIGEKIVGNGGKITFIGLTKPSEKVLFLNENKADIVIANFLKTDKLAKEVDFAMPYFSVAIASLGKKGQNTNLRDLKKVAIKDGFSPALDTCAKACPSAEIIKVKDNNEAWEMIKENKIDGYVNTNLVVMAYPMMDDELEITHKKIGNNMFLSPGVKKGNKELIKAINEAMFELSKA